MASVVAAGPDDVWISGGVLPFPPFLGELLAHWNGTSWTQAHPEQENPQTQLAAIPGTTQTLAVGAAPYLLGTHEPLIGETRGA